MDTKELFKLLNSATNYEEIIKYLPLLQELNLNDQQYVRIYHKLHEKIGEIKYFYQKLAPILYKLLEEVPKQESLYFHASLIRPMYNLQIENYLQFVTSKLAIDINELTYQGSGSSNFAFATHDKIIKIGNRRVTFDFPTFYRLNDLIVQKKFSYFDKHIYLEITPRGLPVTLTNKEISDIKQDFKQANLIVSDPNYQDNFMLFEEENSYHEFRDIDGLHPSIEIPKSKSYQKKKIKLIDLDYIFKSNDPNIIYAPKR